MIIAVTLVLVAIYSRVRLLSVPLERDEGGFAYIAQQMLQGIPPFESGYSMKLMGIHAAYSLFMALFGQSPTAIHFGLLLGNLGSIVLLYYLARQFLPAEGAALTSGVFALLSVSQDFLGVFAHATHFVMLFVLAGLVAFLVWREKGNTFFLLMSGIFMGTAIIMKQNGLFFCPLVLLMFFVECRQRKASLRFFVGKSVVCIVGIIFPYAVILLYVTGNGLFAQFWFWTIEYALDYSSDKTIAESLQHLARAINIVTKTTLPLWIAGITGAFVFLDKGTIIRDKWVLILFIVVSCLAITPGGHFYLHYFVLLLPALSLLIGVAFIGIAKLAGRFISTEVAMWGVLGIIVACSLTVIFKSKSYMFYLSPPEVSRQVYGDNPFAVASSEIAGYIKANSVPGDKIAVLGSEPQIYFYSARQSATKFLFMYPLSEEQPTAEAMQKEMFDKIVTTVPKFIIISLQYTSWLAGPDKIIELLAPMRTFLDDNYTPVGVVDILPTGDVSFSWGKDTEELAPLTTMPIFILQKTDEQSS